MAVGNSYRVPVLAGTVPIARTQEKLVSERTINLTKQSIKGLEDLYGLIRGRANGATIQVTPEQAEAIYWALSGDQVDWQEPSILPADYRLGAIERIVVVEE